MYSIARQLLVIWNIGTAYTVNILVPISRLSMHKHFQLLAWQSLQHAADSSWHMGKGYGRGSSNSSWYNSYQPQHQQSSWRPYSAGSHQFVQQKFVDIINAHEQKAEDKKIKQGTIDTIRVFLASLQSKESNSKSKRSSQREKTHILWKHEQALEEKGKWNNCYVLQSWSGGD